MISIRIITPSGWDLDSPTQSSGKHNCRIERWWSEWREGNNCMQALSILRWYDIQIILSSVIDTRNSFKDLELVWTKSTETYHQVDE